MAYFCSLWEPRWQRAGLAAVVLIIFVSVISASAQEPVTNSGIAASPQTIAVEVEDGTFQLTLLLPEGWTARKAFYGSALIANVSSPLELVPNTLAARTDQILGTVYRVRQGSPRSVTALLGQAGLDAESDIAAIIRQLPRLLAINRRYDVSAPEAFEANGKAAVRAAGTVRVGQALLDAVLVVVDEEDGFTFFEFNTAAGSMSSFLGHIDLIVGSAETGSGDDSQNAAASVPCAGLAPGDELAQSISMTVSDVGVENMTGLLTLRYPKGWAASTQNTIPNASIVMTDHPQGLGGLGSSNPCAAGTVYFISYVFLSDLSTRLPATFPVPVPENIRDAPLEAVVPVMIVGTAPRSSREQMEALAASLSEVQTVVVEDKEIGFQTGEFTGADQVVYPVFAAVMRTESGLAIFSFQLPGGAGASYQEALLAIAGSLEFALS